jgi:uncharacterized sulfatase
MTRQSLLASAIFALALALPGALSAQEKKDPPKRQKLPNIIWISSEDHGPHMGCYGDLLARTPNVDKLAKKGMIFRMCWSNAPVCAPARTTIISGLYPPSTGAEHMRSLTRLPAAFQMFPHYLRLAGYYCTNKSKEDYNLEHAGKVWDDSSNKAHWKNRKAGQPFFAVFNAVKSHESRFHKYDKVITDPSKVRIPAYFPDTKEVRSDLARYYDIVSQVDADMGELVRELAEAGLLEDTIIFYWADHGAGLPRSKRTPIDSGLHVPLVAYFPPAWQHLAPADYKAGAVSNRLVGFIDFAPTMLSIAGIQPPDWMQGHAFAGKYATEPYPYLHGFRGRMDECYDMQRSVSDGRYVYARDYMPHLPAGQHNNYMFLTQTTRVWKKLFDAGKLNEAQSQFWKAPRPSEELYDLQTDPDEVKNLVGSPEHQMILAKLRKVQRDHVLAIRDVGFLPEDEIHVRSANSTPYELGHDPKKYPLERILASAELAGARQATNVPKMQEGLKDNDSAVRYWSALGMLMLGKEGVAPSQEPLRHAMLKDTSPSVRIVAAEAVARFGAKDDFDAALKVLVERAEPKKNSIYCSLAALNALERLGDLARPAAATIKSWPTGKGGHRASPGISSLLSRIRAQLGS